MFKNHLLLRSHNGDKAETFAEVFITLASTKIAFLLPLLMYFRCYGNLKFPLTYNGKSENWLLLLSHCRYFDKPFTDMTSPLPNISVLSKPLNLICCHGNREL